MEAANEDEISLLESIYCMNDEFRRLTPNEIRLKFEDLEIIVIFGNQQRPIFRISHPSLDRSLNEDLHRRIQANDSVSTFDSVQLIRNFIQEHSKEETAKKAAIKPSNFGLLLHLDHMRNSKQYLKTLKSWAKELGLFCKIWLRTENYRGIPLLVIGRENDLNEFEKRLRSRNVDVDSKGKPCKEKMMKVLGKDLVRSENVPVEVLFTVEENKSLEAIIETLKELSLNSLSDSLL